MGAGRSRRRWGRVSGSAQDCPRGAAVLGPPGPGSLGGSGRRPACSSSPEGGRLQGGAGLARPPGDAAAAALRPGSAGSCGSGTPEAEAVSELGAGAGRVCAGPRSPDTARELDKLELLQLCAVLSLSVGRGIWAPRLQSRAGGALLPPTLRPVPQTRRTVGGEPVQGSSDSCGRAPRNTALPTRPCSV